MARILARIHAIYTYMLAYGLHYACLTKQSLYYSLGTGTQILMFTDLHVCMLAHSLFHQLVYPSMSIMAGMDSIHAML